MNSIEPLDMRKCSGCGACAQICPVSSIIIEYDQDGFRKPRVTSNCIQCEKCVRVCPWRSEKKAEGTSPLPECYAGWNTDAEIRQKSSSGGIFTAIAKEIIAQGGVVFGAKYNESFEIIHDFCETEEGLNVFRGSKYAESNLKHTFSEVQNFIHMRRKVLFTGTPCQIAGLKQFLNMESSYLLTMDFLCHGVAPQKLFSSYLLYIQQKFHSIPISVEMRNKSKGWGKFIMKIGFLNHKIYKSKSFMDLFHILFLRHQCLRESCYDCIFATPYRESDITVADFWGFEKLYPEVPANQGISLILTNTDVGRNIYKILKHHGDVESFSVNINDLYESNPRLIKGKLDKTNRESFFNDYSSLPFKSLCQKWAEPLPGTYIPFHKKIYYKIIYEFKKIWKRL